MHWCREGGADREVGSPAGPGRSVGTRFDFDSDPDPDFDSDEHDASV
jgi:hypothetical protein